MYTTSSIIKQQTMIQNEGSLYIKTNLSVLAFARCQNEKVSVSQRQNGLELGPALALELSFPETPETW